MKRSSTLLVWAACIAAIGCSSDNAGGKNRPVSDGGSKSPRSDSRGLSAAGRQELHTTLLTDYKTTAVDGADFVNAMVNGTPAWRIFSRQATAG